LLICRRLQIQKFEVWSQSMVWWPRPRARLSTMVADVMSQDPCLRSARKQASSALFGCPCSGWLRKGEPRPRFIRSQESATASLTTSGVIAGSVPRGLPSTGRSFFFPFIPRPHSVGGTRLSMGCECLVSAAHFCPFALLQVGRLPAGALERLVSLLRVMRYASLRAALWSPAYRTRSSSASATVTAGGTQAQLLTGNGTALRTRTVISPSKNAGSACNNTLETTPCDRNVCPKDCALSSWSTTDYFPSPFLLS
jgi:hypothetical protein